MNKKLQKLLRDPKQFFLDSKDLRPIFRRLGLVKDPEHTGLVDKAGEAKESGFVADPGAGQMTPRPPLGFSTPSLFDLVGDEWLKAESRKPVAVVWGVGQWKRGFVSRYLHDYRTAYAHDHALWTAQKSVLDQHRPLSIIVWGTDEPPEVRAYAETRGIPIYRMADGFIQSAKLGNLDTPALSFVLDRQGIYFDASRPSELEGLLNEHDFNGELRLMRATEALLRVMRGLRVSQYNPATLQSPANLLGTKLKRRVLVIGQAEEDASVRYGLAQGWTDHRLIELARAENPDADIIYQPPLAVARGFRSNLSTMQELQKLCRVLVDEVVLADLFKEVDHVYTITSLSGLEALIHGLPVTVVGAPFYAGWGLTDDRIAIPRRTRRLSLEELFCGAYLLYPRYLTDLEDPVTGCLAAMLRVTADRKQHVNRLISAKTVDSLADQIAASDRWPVLLSPKHWPSIKEKYGKNLLSLFSVRAIFARCNGDYYQRSIAYLLADKLRTTVTFESFLNQLRGSVRQQHFAALLTDSWRVAPSAALPLDKAWWAEKDDDLERPRQSLNYLAGNSDYTKDLKEDQPFPIQKYAAVLALAQFELRQKNFEEAYRLFNLLLLSGHVQGDVIAGIAEIARLRFDFASAAQLLKVYNHYDRAWKAGRGHLLEARAQSLAGDALAALEAMALASKLNPQYVESVASIEDVLERIIGDLPYADAMLAAYEVDDSGSPIARAKALIASECAAEAERVLLDYTPRAAETVKYYLMLSLAYSYQGKLERAKQLVVNLLPRQPTLPLYREGLRLSVLMNDYEWGQKLLAEATARELDVGDLYQRKIRFGMGDIQGAYASFRKYSPTKLLRAYCGGSYVQSLDFGNPVTDSTQVLVVAHFGPGDEIRFASLYRKMRQRCGSSKVTFTCDPRLYPLLRRSYTELEFVPVGRIRNLAWVADYESFNQLPGSDLHLFFDNAGWALAKSADKVILTTDALGDVIEDYSSFKGAPYLKADPDSVAAWRTRLAAWAEKPLIGLSWRSSLGTASRNEHYFSVEELAPLFMLDHVRFVNLQYDECADELAWLEQHFPGRILHFGDLDQYNDLAGVAALMSCLDLIIAPATTVVELAGALGRPTLLLSNSSELHWRKLPGTATDVWHRSVTHVEGDVLGDKAALARAARDALAARQPSMAKARQRAHEFVY